MLALDASSILHAWDNYPIDQFPPLWAWLAERVDTEELVIAGVALDEVQNKSPECAKWLKALRIRVLPATQAILMDALRIKALLGIVDDVYGSGVSENDMFIIATARAHGAELMTDEARQSSPNKSRRNYKIPAVCDLPEVQVKCLNFVDYFKRSKAVFV